jgi:hypothetical protein
VAFTNSLASLWSDKVLMQVNKTFVYASPYVCNRDYEGEVQDAYETVKLLGVNRPIVKSYAQDTDIDIDELTDFEQDLVLNQADYYAFQVDDIQKIQQVPKLTPKALSLAGVGMADTADQYVAAQLDAAVGGTHTDTYWTTPAVVGSSSAPSAISVASFSDPSSGSAVYEYLIDLASTLTEAGVPKQDRYVILPPWAVGDLAKDLRFTGYPGYHGNTVLTDGFASDAQQNGLVGSVAGLNVIESLNVPTGTFTTPSANSPYKNGNSASQTYYRIVAGVPSATTFANQIVKTEAYRNPNRFSDVVRGLHTYGLKVVWPERLVGAYIAQGV